MSQNITEEGQVQKIYSSGKKVIKFPNGVKRSIYPNGYTIVHFTNNDIKQVSSRILDYYCKDTSRRYSDLLFC